MGKKFEVTPEIKERVINAYNRGSSFNIIGKFICPRRHIREILEEAGVPIKGFGDSWRDSRLDLASKK